MLDCQHQLGIVPHKDQNSKINIGKYMDLSVATKSLELHSCYCTEVLLVLIAVMCT